MKRKTVALQTSSASHMTGAVLPRSTSGPEMKVDLAKIVVPQITGAALKATGACPMRLIATLRRKTASVLVQKDGIVA